MFDESLQPGSARGLPLAGGQFSRGARGDTPSMEQPETVQRRGRCSFGLSGAPHWADLKARKEKAGG